MVEARGDEMFLQSHPTHRPTCLPANQSNFSRTRCAGRATVGLRNMADIYNLRE